ncbi:MAG: preprotein translocase subunit SecG [Calditrichaceae bacterium]|nr:preprotein translocase subunit SecG [Calditrichaceae bacterium]MBN2709126.1 preprotein translocase subunit SecG [Calditrichaceae bacterium]RQV96082.1 MAG: preprotein translocase subunit SecG [Calditrichota bacterium]
MYTLLIILFVLISFAMVVVILLQAGKGKGLAGSIGGGMGGSSIFGGRGAADFLSKATTWIAALYMVFAVIIGIMYRSEVDEAQQSLIQQHMQEQEAIETPNLPMAPMPEPEQGADQDNSPE